MLERALLILAASSLLACSSSPKPHPTAATVAPDASATELATSSSITPPEVQRTPTPPELKREKNLVEIDVNYDDCTVLAATYEKVWFRNAEESPTKRGSEGGTSSRPAGVDELRSAAQTAGANWLKACAQVAGTPMPRKNLVCASKAKTLERFNDCWDGKAD